jgi:rhamnosyltransferase
MDNLYLVVIVSYNPSEKDLNSIRKIIETYNYVVIVDNSSEDQKEVCRLKTENCSVICNKSNKGLAFALNQGCRFGVEHNFKYCLLLDQDSVMTDGSLEQLIKIHENLGDKCGIASPKIFLRNGENFVESNYLVKTCYGFKKKRVENEPLKVLINITSGSMIKLETWKKVGEFRSDFFIEGIDDEYALRLNSMGYDVIISNEAKLVQQYGNMSENEIWGKKVYTTNHSALRRTYCYRNKIVIMKEYFFKEKSYVFFQILSLIRKLLLIIIFEDKKCEKLTGIFRGIKYGLQGKMGKLTIKNNQISN